MNFWERLRQFFQLKEEQQPKSVRAPVEGEEQGQKIDFTLPVTEEEKELVSVIAAAILAGENPDAHIRVKEVTRIDTEKEIAAAIVAAIAAGDQPNATFVLKSIEKIP